LIEAAVGKSFGAFSLDANLGDGGFVCISGRNGSGKTTLLRILAGILPPDRGSVKVNSRELTGIPIERRGVVLVTPDSAIPGMKVDAHLTWGARVKGKRVSDEKLRGTKKDLEIESSGRVGDLSTGMRGRVALGTALLSEPEAILVDEAFSNLHEREKFISCFLGLTSAAGIDVLFSSQDGSDARLAQHHYSIEDGRTARRF